MSRLRIAKEQRRTCVGCGSFGEMYYVAIGSVPLAFRICSGCLGRISRGVWRVDNEGLDAVEVG